MIETLKPTNLIETQISDWNNLPKKAQDEVIHIMDTVLANDLGRSSTRKTNREQNHPPNQPFSAYFGILTLPPFPVAPRPSKKLFYEQADKESVDAAFAFLQNHGFVKKALLGLGGLMPVSDKWDAFRAKTR